MFRYRFRYIDSNSMENVSKDIHTSCTYTSSVTQYKTGKIY